MARLETATQPGVVGGDAAAFDQEEDVGTLLLDGGPRSRPGPSSCTAGREVELHLVEARRAFGGQQLPALVDRLLGLGAAQQGLWRRPCAAVAGNPAGCVRLSGRRGRRVLVRAARGWPGASVSSWLMQAARPVKAARRRTRSCGCLAQRASAWARASSNRLQPDVALQPAVGRGLQPHLGDHAQRAQRDLGGLEDVGVPVRAAVDDVALRRDQPQGGDVAVQRLDRRARAVGAGGQGPARACLLMSGRLAMARPLAARAGRSAPSRVPAATIASSPSQAMIPDSPVQRHQGSRRSEPGR